MNGFIVEPNGQLPFHAQIKDQIRLACLYQRLRVGNPLPSIRHLAHLLGVGDGVVRRAYRELCEAGLLEAQGRRHVVGELGGVAASRSDAVRASTEQCDRLLAWAREERLSTIALSRLLLWRALAHEANSPSYILVDTCHLAAERSARKIAKAWGVSVRGVALSDFIGRSSDFITNATAVLASEYLHKDVVMASGEFAPRVFSIAMRLDARLRSKMARLPAASAVLLICGDRDVSRACRAMLRHFNDSFDGKYRCRVKTTREIRDLHGLLEDKRCPMTLFSPIVWEELPDRLRRLAKAGPAFCEPDTRSLERLRVAVGVLL